MTLTNPTPLNTTDTGVVSISPIAFDDTYPQTVIGNVSINSANIPYSVVTNDFQGQNGGTPTITAFDATTTAGGQIVMTTSGADIGKFTYNPPPGFEGTDTFTYTLTNTVGSSVGTVKIPVAGMVWFINNGAAACTTLAAGCGRLSNPFSTLAAFQALNNGTGNNPAANDNIFVFESATGYGGGVTLLSGQKFIGQDATATLATITGLTPPSGSAAFPAMNSGNATVTNITGTVTLNTNATVRGLQINSTTSTGMNDPVAAITGVSVSEVSVTTTTGTGVDFSGTAGTLTFTGLTTSGGAGANLVGNAGGTFNFSNIAVSSGANAAFTATGGGTVNATQNNTSIVNTLTTTTGTALNVANTTIGASGLTFRSISANGAPNGINLNTTGAGSFTVIGDGASDPANTTRGRTTAMLGGGTITLGSGGTILNTTGAAISLNSAASVTLRNISLTGNAGGVNSGADGIHATSVTGLTLDNMLVTGHLGNDGLSGSAVSDLNLLHMDIHTNAKTAGVEASDIWDVRLDNLTGTSAVSNSLFFDSREDIFTITNGGSSNLTLTVTNSEFRDTDLGTSPAVGDAGFQMLASGSAVTTLTATGCTFKNVRLTGFHYTGNNTASGTVKVMNSVFGGTAAGGDAANQNGVDIDIDHQGAGTTLNFEVSGNTTRQGFRANDSTSINIFLAGLSTATSQMVGTVKNNIIGIAGTANSGSDLGAGIALDCTGAGTMTASVTGNTVNQVRCNSGNVFDLGTSQTAKANVRIRNNTFNGNPAQVNPQYGIHINGGTGTAGENNPLCLDIGANSVSMPASAIATIDLDSFPGNVTNLVGYAGGTNNGGQIQTFFSANNTLTGPAPLYTSAGGTTQAAVAPCSTFVFPTRPTQPGDTDRNPLLLATGGVEKAATEQSSVVARTAIPTIEQVSASLPQPAAFGLLRQADLDSVVATALARWEATGLSTEQVAILHKLHFEVAALSNLRLGEASGNDIRVDNNAGGNGWFVGTVSNASAPRRRRFCRGDGVSQKRPTS